LPLGLVPAGYAVCDFRQHRRTQGLWSTPPRSPARIRHGRVPHSPMAFSTVGELLAVAYSRWWSDPVGAIFWVEPCRLGRAVWICVLPSRQQQSPPVQPAAHASPCCRAETTLKAYAAMGFRRHAAQRIFRAVRGFDHIFEIAFNVLISGMGPPLRLEGRVSLMAAQLRASHLAAFAVCVNGVDKPGERISRSRRRIDLVGASRQKEFFRD